MNEATPPTPALLPDFPPRDDPTAWADWWHRWAEIGRRAASLDPNGALYEPVYGGDHLLPDLSPRREPE